MPEHNGIWRCSLLFNIGIYLLCSFFLFSCVQPSSSPALNLPPNEVTMSPNSQQIDFSGHWEKNYRRSDDVNSKFQLFLYDVQRSAASTENRGGIRGQGGLGTTGEALTGLARLTQDITKVVLLDVEQNDNSVHIHREDNFSLNCDYFEQAFVITENPFGSELCGWNGDQMVFQINMLDGLSIHHQVTLSPDQRELNITTTVRSSRVPSPFTISSYYRRYTPPVNDYDCVFTLSRNNVCSRSGR